MKLSVNNNGHHNVETAVLQRYAASARSKEEALCCPVDYDLRYLKVIPKEILEKDYGCGDPSRFLLAGDTVLDLGSGGGKICFMASQIVGPQGKVIGVDFNQAMLALARKHQRAVGDRIGWHNIEFKRGRIQDLKTDLDALDKRLSRAPISSAEEYLRVSQEQTAPLIADTSIDVIVSNCVLNLVRPEDKRRLFNEMYRVLKKGGRVAISDIVSDEVVPDSLRRDPELWSGCISGAFEEQAFLTAFEEAGFYGIAIEKRDAQPWRVVKGIEFRSVTVTAYKGKEGPCWERNQAVIYKGPWKTVVDDDGHTLKRGVRMAVCDKTYNIYAKAPYQNDIWPVPPRRNIPLSKVEPFACDQNALRHPRETKGKAYKRTTRAQSTCLDGGCC